VIRSATPEIVEIVSAIVWTKILRKQHAILRKHMQRVIGASTWRAIWLALGLSLICPPAELIAATMTSSAGQADEPFQLSTAMVTTGKLLEKWLDVEREIDDERLVLKACEEDRASCDSRTALQFLAIIDSARALEGRARIGEINRAINLKIRPMSDLALYGEEDVWSPPLATLAAGAGDCEDYAIAKFVALQEAGVSAVDLRIVILRDDIWKTNHAVVAARLDGNWLMLDNRHMVMPEDHQVRKYYRPIFLIDHHGVRRYSSSPSTSEESRGHERVAGQLLH
jgi:predicted transglutaminase-like cysteine proteinase